MNPNQLADEADRASPQRASALAPMPHALRPAAAAAGRAEVEPFIFLLADLPDGLLRRLLRGVERHPGAALAADGGDQRDLLGHHRRRHAGDRAGHQRLGDGLRLHRGHAGLGEHLRRLRGHPAHAVDVQEAAIEAHADVRQPDRARLPRRRRPVHPGAARPVHPGHLAPGQPLRHDRHGAWRSSPRWPHHGMGGCGYGLIVLGIVIGGGDRHVRRAAHPDDGAAAAGRGVPLAGRSGRGVRRRRGAERARGLRHRHARPRPHRRA